MTHSDRRTVRRAAVRHRLIPAAAAASGLAVLLVAGCSSSTSDSGATQSPGSFSPNPSNFSGQVPSALASAKTSALESVSAAASSASAAASSFAASVSAQVEADRAEFTSTLAAVSGSGNAVSDVTLTGVPRAQIGGLNAVVVTITNSTTGTANYAVKVEFVDSSGQVVDSSIVGAKNLAAGGHAQPVAFTRQSPDAALVARVAQAQRY